MRDDLPQAIWRQRLALRAAAASVQISGRFETTQDLRDAVMFLRDTDQAGPAGEIYLSWRRAVTRSKLHYDMQARLLVARGAPVNAAAEACAQLLDDAPRREVDALILADAVLARALRWRSIVPLLASGVSRRDLRKRDDDLRLAFHHALLKPVRDAVQLAADLDRRAGRLRLVAPKLRARGSDAAVTLFLTQDAVTPGMLTSLRSDRSARRFCDRLVELGAARELSGRDTFRMYGL